MLKEVLKQHEVPIRVLAKMTKSCLQIKYENMIKKHIVPFEHFSTVTSSSRERERDQEGFLREIQFQAAEQRLPVISRIENSKSKKAQMRD